MTKKKKKQFKPWSGFQAEIGNHPVQPDNSPAIIKPCCASKDLS